MCATVHTIRVRALSQTNEKYMKIKSKGSEKLVKTNIATNRRKMINELSEIYHCG